MNFMNCSALLDSVDDRDGEELDAVIDDELDDEEDSPEDELEDII
jgi:hypothetical protein